MWNLIVITLAATAALLLGMVDGCSKVKYTTSCGFMWLSRCTRYRRICVKVNGGWSSWDSWQKDTDCSKSCGGGYEYGRLYRNCTNPKPAYGGSYCVGGTMKTSSRSCNRHFCSIDGEWSSWSWTEWVASTSCSVTCGGGRRLRNKRRTCTNPRPDHGGSKCPGISEDSVHVKCNDVVCPGIITPVRQISISGVCTLNNNFIIICPVDGGWSHWFSTSYTSCSKSCGGGTRIWTGRRYCRNPYPAHGGKDCVGSSTKTETLSCKLNSCQIDSTTKTALLESSTAITKSPTPTVQPSDSTINPRTRIQSTAPETKSTGTDIDNTRTSPSSSATMPENTHSSTVSTDGTAEVVPKLIIVVTTVVLGFFTAIVNL